MLHIHEDERYIHCNKYYIVKPKRLMVHIKYLKVII